MASRWGRSMREAGQPPAFQGHTRRQALPVIGVAARWDWCVGRIARPFGPPHPPAKKAPPTSGKPQEGGGAGHSFCQCRGAVACAKTCGSALVLTQNPRGSKAAARFGPVEVPRVSALFPQVGAFFPYLPFCGFGPFSLSLSLFLEERERRRERGASKPASTGLIFCNAMYPRIRSGIHGFSVDGWRPGIVDWRGFARGLGVDPRSTGGNACVPPYFVASGGVHGAHGMD